MMSNADGYNVPNVDPDSLEWFTAADSGDQGACVEVAHLPVAIGGVFLRHSKERSGFYYYDNREWSAFLSGAKNGEFDPPALDA
ncbi:DUF397 domain-containing protein [Kitasatospora sp. NPDC058263]